MNLVALVGNLVRDPVGHGTQGESRAVTFTIACQRRYKNKDGKYDADFIDCVAWRKTGEFIEKNFKKGQKIGVTGSIQVRNYEKDGQKRYVTEIVIENAEFVTPPGQNAQNGAPEPPPEPMPDEMTPADDDDGLPF